MRSIWIPLQNTKTMKWQEYKEHMREEWEFHKRNPELFFVWAAYATAIIIALFSDN
jgi:hypothetical protein